MGTRISLDECEFAPASVVDPVGHVFRYQGRLFRGIYPAYVDFILKLLEHPEIEQWFSAGLIPTWQTDLLLDPFALVLEHKQVPFVTVPAEWPAEALREAALCYLRLASALAAAGLCLKDAHCGNILFDAVVPYFVDWGSIRPMSELDWGCWYAEFRKNFLIPLYLFSLGQSKLARALLREHHGGVGNYIIDCPFTQRVPEEPYLIVQRREYLPERRVFQKLAEYVSALTFPHLDGEFAAYEQPQFTGLEDVEKYRLKDRILRDLVASTSGTCRTVLDIGCNRGLDSEMVASLGKRVVAGDIEESCLDELFLRTQKSGLDILVLYFDVVWPVGESGIMNSIPPAHQRIACDLTLALALVHHLVFKNNIGFEPIGRSLSRLTRNTLIVEFVPADDCHVANWAPERFPWYTLENFVKVLMRYFKEYTIFPSEPPPRKLVVFEGRKWKPERG